MRGPVGVARSKPSVELDTDAASDTLAGSDLATKKTKKLPQQTRTKIINNIVLIS
jgi:hypothetical protein